MLTSKTEENNILCGIWKIEESIQELYSILNNSMYETDTHLQNISNKEILREKLAVRALLKHLLNSDINIEYSETGKPCLKNSNLQISISHTRGYAAVAISVKNNIGIDIEKISDKVEKVRSKFINSNEYISEKNELTHLLLHWSAKESIYKALNQEGVELKEDVSIDHFTPQNSGLMTASTQNLANNMFFEIKYIVCKEYVLTLAYIKN